MESRVHRGSYGPLPVDTLRYTELFRSRAGAIVAGLLGRHFVFDPMRALNEKEQQILAACAQRAAFSMLQSFPVPRDFRVVAADAVTGGRDAAIIRLEARGCWFELSQRARWLDLREELTLAGVPFTKVPGFNVPIFVVHGRYGGEPIDHSYWISRHAVILEHREVRLELRETIGTGPGLSILLRCAAEIANSSEPVG
jgi:hypothetical protein